MSNIFKDEIEKDSQRPLTGTTVIWIFVGLALVSSLLDFITCWQSTEWLSPLKTTIVQLYIISLAFGWFSFTVSSRRDLFFNLVCLSLGGGVLIAMILIPSTLLFWTAFLFILTLSIIDVLHNIKTEGAWNKILACIFTAWVIAGFVITFGSTQYLPYADPAFAISEVHLLLDVRYLITITTFTVFVGKSIAEAAEEDRPTISPIAPFQIRDATVKWRPSLAAIIQPTIVFINVFLSVCHVIANAIWHVLAMVYTYLKRTALNLANHFLDLILSSSIWLSIFRIVSTLVIITFLAVAARGIAPSVVSFLQSDTSISNISTENVGRIVLFTAIFIMALISIISASKIWDLVMKPLANAALGATILILAWAVSGLVMRLMVWFDIFKLQSFNSLGVYTLLFILIIGSISVYQILKRLASNPTPLPFRQSPFSPLQAIHHEKEKAGEPSDKRLEDYLFPLSVIAFIIVLGLGIAISREKWFAERNVLNERESREEAERQVKKLEGARDEAEQKAKTLQEAKDKLEQTVKELQQAKDEAERRAQSTEERLKEIEQPVPEYENHFVK